LATQIEERLEQDGLKLWLDDSEIRLGDLLRKELQSAIQDCRVVILLWSRAAAKSRWVASEVLTAFHLDRFIVACVRNRAPLPYFLQNTIHLDVHPHKTGWLERLTRAVRESPDAANEVPATMSSQSRELRQAIQLIFQGQRGVTDSLENRDIRGAKEMQQLLDGVMVEAEKAWPLEPVILNLAGYHHKNAYMLEHWAAIQAGRPPKDPSLERAERSFFETLFVNPNDYSALNGLGSILTYERDYEAAEFFIRRAIALAEQDGIDYAAAKHDLAMILATNQR
jgi:tetratricopeptide (TPR) repeat protein